MYVMYRRVDPGTDIVEQQDVKDMPSDSRPPYTVAKAATRQHRVVGWFPEVA